MIKFLDLQKVNAQYSADLKEAASKVIDSGWYLMGQNTLEFEKNLADFLGAKHVVACGNGLDSLRLIIRAYKEKGLFSEGDEIIVPANTYIATILAITDNHLLPVLAEPDESTLNIDIPGIEKLITSKTKAILVVHLYGSVCWGKELERLAVQYDLKIIEDNAQAIGAKWIDGRRSGTLGDAAGLSFYPGKNLGALGDSGAVSTNDEQIAEIIRSIANYGSARKYVNEYRGLNSRMDEIQAAFLNIKLRYLDTENSKRREIANFYRKSITNPKVRLPALNMNFEEGHIWHLFVVRTKKRDQLQKYLSDNDIQTLIHYPIPPHKQKCYQEYSSYELPVTSRIAAECLSLPISPVMTAIEVERVVEVINNWEKIWKSFQMRSH